MESFFERLRFCKEDFVAIARAIRNEYLYRMTKRLHGEIKMGGLTPTTLQSLLVSSKKRKIGSDSRGSLFPWQEVVSGSDLVYAWICRMKADRASDTGARVLYIQLFDTLSREAVVEYLKTHATSA